MPREDTEKEIRFLTRRFTELSRTACSCNYVTFSDFLNLNEQNILHSMPASALYSPFLLYGGYETAERQMAAFLPETLSLRLKGNNTASSAADVDRITPESDVSQIKRYGRPAGQPDSFQSGTSSDYAEVGFPFVILQIFPANVKFAGKVTQRDYLGALMSLGVERSRLGDILVGEQAADGACVFAHADIAEFLLRELRQVRRTTVSAVQVEELPACFAPRYREITGTVASVRLDSLLALAFSSSRSHLAPLISAGKVFVNGRLVTSNGYAVKEGDVISVRGMGKFRYGGAGGKTKKEKIRVTVFRYI